MKKTRDFIPYLLALCLIAGSGLLIMASNPSQDWTFDNAFAGNSGTTYYVSPTGNDANSGTSESQPWKSISKVNSVTYKPGDVIRFKAGGTWSGDIKATASGEADNYIVYSTYGGSERAKIQVNHVGFTADGQDYIRIENFEMSGGYRGIYFIHGAQYGYVYNCYCHDQGGNGIQFGAYQSPPYGDTQGATVDSCIVENTVWGIGTQSVTGTDSAWSGFTIKNSQISNCTACCIKIMETVTDIHGNTIKRCGDYEGYHGIYYGNPSRISGGSIKYNWIEDGYGSGLKISGGKTYIENITVAYNVFYQNGYYGIWTEWGAHDVNFDNNVFYNNGYKGNGADFYANYSHQYNLILKNNIFYNDTGKSYIRIYPDSEEGFLSDNNLFYGNSDWYFQGTSYSSFSNWKNGTGQDGYSLYTDPLFLQRGSDFHLTTDSLCIDHGMDVGETRDRAGHLVPQGSAPDIGAYEFIRDPYSNRCVEDLNGHICGLDETCPAGNWLSSSDSDRCCAQVCQPACANCEADLEQDGKVNSLDIQLWVNVFLHIETDPNIIDRADVDGNGLIDRMDFQQLVNKVFENP